MSVQRKRNIALLVLLLFAWHPHAPAYSLLTHEQLIDLTWQDSIVPFLLSRYPNLTPAQLDHARAYAYGGCVIQDMGYYPFGDQLFSDLTHYVRTGDFVLALFRNAHNADELAFAVGALSHYVGDSIGHSQATNRAVALQFPKLKARYGPSVNYAQGKHPHVQVEFAFDIDQITQRRFAPLGYLRHIGMNVSTRQLALAFYETYGITEDFTRRGSTFNIDLYRMATRKLIPRAAYALTLIHRSQEPPDPDNSDAKQITIDAANASKLSGWDAYRRKAGFQTHLIAFFIRIVPKFGPLAMLATKGPTPAAEADYLHSLVSSTSIIRNRLTLLTPVANRGAPPAGITVAALPAQAEDPRRPFVNRDLDTGQPVKPGGYSLTDKTYAALLARLTQNPQQSIPPGIKQDVLAYYADPNAPIVTKNDPRAWDTVQEHLKVLAAMSTSNEPAPYPTYGEGLNHPSAPASDLPASDR
jgi:hypothetical protein